MSELERIQEEKWIKESQNGNLASFEALVTKYQVHIYNIARRYFDKEDAEDMTQEVLIKLFNGLGTFRYESSFKTFVYSVSVNKCRDELRRRQLRHQVLGAVAIDEEFDIADHASGPEKALVEKETRERIEEAIRMLPEANRQVIILREVMGYSYEEISEMEDCPVGTVKSRIKRGREQLRSYLEEGGEMR